MTSSPLFHLETTQKYEQQLNRYKSIVLDKIGSSVNRGKALASELSLVDSRYCLGQGYKKVRIWPGGGGTRFLNLALRRLRQVDL